MSGAPVDHAASAAADAELANFGFRTADHDGSARRGWFKTPHGVVETPAFMPVGTHATIKGLSVEEVATTGAQMILSNAYHLYLRPGDKAVRALGGLHAFSRWKGPMLTDSGGFQVFSLSQHRTVREQGIEFRSHLDGSKHDYTPEAVMRIERNIGADVIMQLDELIEGKSEFAASRSAMALLQARQDLMAQIVTVKAGIAIAVVIHPLKIRLLSIPLNLLTTQMQEWPQLRGLSQR